MGVNVCIGTIYILRNMLKTSKDMQGIQNLAPWLTSSPTGIVIEIRTTFCTVLVF